jgi:hypothetical protein
VFVKIPHPPKVELELGEETTTSHFSKPNDSTINEFKFPCTSMNPRAKRRYFKFTRCWTLHLELGLVWSGHK